MSGIQRVTEPTLDVLRVLLKAYRDGRDVYGWEIRQQTGRSGPAVLGIFGRLEDGGLVEGRWDDSEARGPRRRYYRLTEAGEAEAQRIIAARTA